MSYQRISDADKQRLYDAFNQGEDYFEVARLLGIKRNTAYCILRRIYERDGVLTLPCGGVRRKLVTDETRDTAVAIVEEHPEFTQEQINAELQVRLPNAPCISRATLANMLAGNLIVKKKLEDAVAEQNSDRTKRLRLEFADWMMNTGVNLELIYIDEAGFHLRTKRTRGRARRGQRAVRVVAGRRGPSLTMTLAVSNRRGLVHHNLIQGGMNGERFNHFLEQVPLVAGQDTCLLFDNARAHQAQEANLPDHVEVRTIPPYSPFLNTVENCFSTWKNAVKRELANVREELLLQPHEERMETLVKIAEEVVNVITRQGPELLLADATLPPDCKRQNDIM